MIWAAEAGLTLHKSLVAQGNWRNYVLILLKERCKIKMGGRGVISSSGSGQSNGNYVKEDNSPVVLSVRNMTATENVLKSMNSETIKAIADYVDGAIYNVTGERDIVALNMIAGAKGRAFAWMDANGTLGINDAYFKNDAAKIKAAYERCVQSGFHPSGTNFNDIAVHEAGHWIDRMLTKKNNDGMRASTHIVRQAIKNLKANGDKRTSYEIQKSLSGYGADFYRNHTGNNFVETYAEAIADYGKNKGKANALSIEIARLTRENMNR